MSPRKANLESSIYFGSDGRWHGRVTMGTKNDGSPDRRHRSAKTETEIKRKVKELERQRDQGRATKAGRVPTVARWMETYLTDIASLTLKPRSLDDYWSKTRNDIVPGSVSTDSTSSSPSIWSACTGRCSTPVTPPRTS